MAASKSSRRQSLPGDCGETPAWTMSVRPAAAGSPGRVRSCDRAPAAHPAPRAGSRDEKRDSVPHTPISPRVIAGRGARYPTCRECPAREAACCTASRDQPESDRDLRWAGPAGPGEAGEAGRARRAGRAGRAGRAPRERRAPREGRAPRAGRPRGRGGTSAGELGHRERVAVRVLEPRDPAVVGRGPDAQVILDHPVEALEGDTP